MGKYEEWQEAEQVRRGFVGAYTNKRKETDELTHEILDDKESKSFRGIKKENPTLFESAEFICEHLKKYHEKDEIIILRLCASVFGLRLVWMD